MSPREERALRNEGIFRDVNAHIADIEERLRDAYIYEPLHLVCECSQIGCTYPIEVPPAEFDRVRAAPLRFFVTPGHEDLDFEYVVEEHPGYLVVEKHEA
jgi:hypothetical protein